MSSTLKTAGLALGAFTAFAGVTYCGKKYHQRRVLKRENANDLTKATHVLNRLVLELPASRMKECKMRVAKWSLPLTEVYVEHNTNPDTGVSFVFRTVGMSELKSVNLSKANDCDSVILLECQSNTDRAMTLTAIESAIQAIVKTQGLRVNMKSELLSGDDKITARIEIIESK